MDQAIIETMRIGYFRIGVFQPLFDEAINQLERHFGDNSSNITRYAISLGSRDSETGWRAITYTSSTLKGVAVNQGAAYTIHNVGFYAREDKMFLTVAPVNVYDQLAGVDEQKFTVKTRRLHTMLDSHLSYELQCSEAVLFQESPGATTWSLTRPRDPRYRTKLFLDTYLRSAQITKDDDSTEASTAVIFSDPPYPLELEFRASSDPVYGLYAVGLPVETPLVDPVTKSPYAYEAEVPITVSATNSVDVSGTSLWWKMVAELKYVCEQNPKGSLRTPSTQHPKLVHLGSTPLWQSNFILKYLRDITT